MSIYSENVTYLLVLPPTKIIWGGLYYLSLLNNGLILDSRTLLLVKLINGKYISIDGRKLYKNLQLDFVKDSYTDKAGEN